MRPALLLLALFSSATISAAQWPQFRGPGSNGVAEGSHLPETWSTTQNVTWKTAIPGHGWSSPIAWGDRIFVTSVIPVGETETPKKGLYFQGERPAPTIEHRFMLFAIDFATYNYAAHKTTTEHRQAMLRAVKQFVENQLEANALNHLFGEQGNIYGALEVAQQEDPDILTEIIAGMAVRRYFDTYGYSLRVQEWITAVLEKIKEQPNSQELQHWLWGKLGNAYTWQGKHDLAFSAYQKAFSLAPNSSRQAILLALMAKAQAEQGNDEEADHYFQKAERQAEQDNDIPTLIFVLEQQTVVAGNRKEYLVARNYATKCGELIAQAGDCIREIYFKLNWGSIEFEIGDLNQALLYYHQAYDMAQEQNNLVLIACLSYPLGQAYYALKKYHDMMKYLLQARELLRQLGGHTAVENDVVAFIQKVQDEQALT